MQLTISIGYTPTDRARDYIPTCDGYQPGADQDTVTITLPDSRTLEGLSRHDLAEAVYVATNAPTAALRHGTPGAREVAAALYGPTSQPPHPRRRPRALTAGDTVTINDHTLECLAIGFAKVVGYEPPTAATTRSPRRAQFLTDMITTAVEGGINHWATVSAYRWYSPTLDGGTALPGPGDTANAHVTVHEDGTEGEGRVFTVGLTGIEHALDRIAAGPVEGMSEQRRNRIRRAYQADDHSETDLDSLDADDVMQLACFGVVIYT